MATNIDLSYAQNVFGFVELNKTKRKVTVSLFTRPVQTAKKDLDKCSLPDGTIFQHWGVMVEFEEIEGHNRCVYTFDADVKKEMKKPDGENNILTDILQLVCTLMSGEFVITAFAYGPNKEYKEHPHAKNIKKLDSPQVIGVISPHELVNVGRRCANLFSSKSYNVVFNNCQDFANSLLKEIEGSMENVTQSSSGAKWTSGDVTTASLIGLGAVAAIGAGISLLSKTLSTEQQEETKPDKKTIQN